MSMEPALFVAIAIFATFLIVLALIAFAAFRFSAKREGPSMGAAGGCALAAVLLGAAFFALIGFVIFLAVMFVHHVNSEGGFDGVEIRNGHDRFRIEEEWKWPPEEKHDDQAPAVEPGADGKGEIRQY